MSVYGIILVRIQFECTKIRTRITPNTDTFHAVTLKYIEETKNKWYESTFLIHYTKVSNHYNFLNIKINLINLVPLDSHCQVEYQNAKYFRKEINQNWKRKNIKRWKNI